MNKNWIFIVKGISGTGKSSRVLQTLKFFEHIGCTISPFTTVNPKGKTVECGLLVEEINLVFIGKIYETNGTERWQGYDAMTSSFGSAALFSEFLIQNCEKHSFVVEGAGITLTNRLRPEFLITKVGYTNIMLQYYNYNNRDEYLKRIIYRSGEPPKSDAMWVKNKSYIIEVGKTQDEIDKGYFAYLFEDSFDAPISDFGDKMLMLLEMEDFIESFREFTQSFDYINKNKF